ncbi:hypothetical protein [Hymenobacter volaticus]|uniref:Uncharacterized protein n=1 Tax=Hymenobacter volaticus TaxID=2932254 RepID=A0ABY4G5M7_9BACT|nr:hypothetical protein [Hymenobacter volaticus]UOQ66195.1 hypothetical protein MUN86_22320 [Hymenobacter volaticus]
MTKQLVLSALAVATLSLAACSSEPSDWRPENKVSVDMVEPGSRSSDNFDQHTAAAADQSKGGAIERPISSHVDLEGRERPSADANVSADAKKAEVTKRAEDRAAAGAKPVKSEDEPAPAVNKAQPHE